MTGFNLNWTAVDSYKILKNGGELTLKDGSIAYSVTGDRCQDKIYLYVTGTVGGITTAAVESIHVIDQTMALDSQLDALAMCIVAACRAAHNAVGPACLQALRLIYGDLPQIEQLDNVI